MPLTSSLTPRARLAVRVAGIALALALAALSAHTLLHIGTHGVAQVLFDNWLYNGLLVGCGCVCLARARLVGKNRRAWLLLAGGVLIWAVGDIYWDLAINGRDTLPSPSPADACWLLFYIPVYFGLLELMRSKLRSLPAGAWLDGLVGVLGVGALAAALLFPPIVAATEGGLATVMTNLAYPLGDILLLAMVVGMFALTGWRPGRSWTLIGAALVVLAVADSLFLWLVATDRYAEGSFVDLLWPAGMVILAFAAWQTDREARPVAFEGWRVLAAPSLFSLSAVALLVADHGDTLNVPALVLATATVLAAFVRTAVSFREIRQLADSRRQAMTDDLTGLANRRALARAAELAIAQAAEDGASVTLVMADLDRFKELNDALGHDVGDELLERVGPRIADRVPHHELVARVGGDEFAVLLPRGAGPSEGLAAAAAVRGALGRPFRLTDLTVHMEAGAGVASWPDHAATGKELLQRAEKAMYGAKERRTGTELYTAERHAASRDQIALIGSLGDAIEAGQLVLHYQPKVALRSGAVTGVEGLVRWHHPERGIVPPGDWIPLAEQTDLMRPLTLSLFEQAVLKAAEWSANGIGDLDAAVNISAASLLDSSLPDKLAGILARHSVPAERLRLEITESAAMVDPQRALEILNHLRELGIRLAVDDFGTGQASLGYLKMLPVDELKIDRSFVSAVATDERDAAIVRATVELAHSLGLSVVAEGIEDEETWVKLCDMGCDIAQGFFIARPMPPDELATWLEERRPGSGTPLVHAAASTVGNGRVTGRG